jgi:flagellar export protein FliJ
MALRFRLARVLRLRTQLRRQAQDEVARVQGDLATVRDKIAAARRAREENRTGEDSAVARGLTGEELTRWRSYERSLLAREQELARESARVAEELARCRDVLLTRRREERQLERLEERAREREDVAEERATMLLLDDLALRQRGERR